MNTIMLNQPLMYGLVLYTYMSLLSGNTTQKVRQESCVKMTEEVFHDMLVSTQVKMVNIKFELQFVISHNILKFEKH